MRSQVIVKNSKKLAISGKQFEYIFKNKIENYLEEKGKFSVKDMNI